MQKSRRFLPGRKSDGSTARKLSHDQVTLAVRAFQERGGLILKLPPEPSGRRSTIGRRWSSGYETIFEQV